MMNHNPNVTDAAYAAENVVILPDLATVLRCVEFTLAVSAHIRECPACSAHLSRYMVRIIPVVPSIDQDNHWVEWWDT